MFTTLEHRLLDSNHNIAIHALMELSSEKSSMVPRVFSERPKLWGSGMQIQYCLAKSCPPSSSRVVVRRASLTRL